MGRCEKFTFDELLDMGARFVGGLNGAWVAVVNTYFERRR